MNCLSHKPTNLKKTILSSVGFFIKCICLHMTSTISIKIIVHAVKDKLSIQAFDIIDLVKPIPLLYEQLFHLDLVYFIVSSFYFIFTPRQIRLRATSTNTHMNLCQTTAGQYKSSTKQLGLRFTDLFLQFKDSIDKCLICQLTT